MGKLLLAKIVRNERKPTVICPCLNACYMQHRLTQVLPDFIAAVMKTPNHNFTAHTKVRKN